MFGNYFKEKKVLVIGHTGFKGAWLSEWLLMLGAKVSGVSLGVPTTPSLFETLNLSDRLNDHRCDIRDLDALLAIFAKETPDVVFHLAAQPIVSQGYDDPKTTFDTNLGGSVNVMEVVRATSSIKAAVMITSDKCYHNVEWPFGYRETDRLGGKDPYSASKACAELAVHAYNESFFKGSNQSIASVRAGNVIGGGDWAENRIVPDCMRAWSNHKPVTIRAPHATRPWQHVLEPLSGYLLLASKLDQSLSGQAYNFGPDASVNASVSALIHALAVDWDGATIDVNPSTMHHDEAGLLKLSCDKALHELNWQPTLKLQDTIQFTSQWYLGHKNNMDMLALTQEQIMAYCEQATRQEYVWCTSTQTA